MIRLKALTRIRKNEGEKCLAEGCTVLTSNRAGKCKEHRTRPCSRCKVTISTSKPTTTCGPCTIVLKKRSDQYNETVL